MGPFRDLFDICFFLTRYLGEEITRRVWLRRTLKIMKGLAWVCLGYAGFFLLIRGLHLLVASGFWRWALLGGIMALVLWIVALAVLAIWSRLH